MMNNEFMNASPIQGTLDKICKDITEQKDSAMALEFTKSICDLMKKNGIFVKCTVPRDVSEITEGHLTVKYGFLFDEIDFSEHDKEFTDEIERLKTELSESKQELEAFHNSATYEEFIRTQSENDEYKHRCKKLESKNAEYGDRINFLEKQVKEMTDKNNSIVHLLPRQPIEVAEVLINADMEEELLGGKMYRIFEVNDLRQIAEHLLIYCDFNEDRDNE